MSDSIRVSVVEFGNRPHYQLQWPDPVTGRKKTRSSKIERGGRKQRALADKAAGKLQAALQEGRHHDPLKTSWAEFKERYAAEVMPGMAPATRDKIEIVWGHVDRLWPAPKRLAEFTTEAVSRFGAKLQEGRSVNTAGIYLRHLKAALNWAAEIGLMHKAPKVRIPTADRGGKLMKGRPITGEEFERILLAVPKVVRDASQRPQWVRLLRGLWWSGLRLSEALALSWDDQEAVAVWMQPGYKPAIRFKAEGHKARRAELVPLAPEFAMMLERVPEAKRHGPVFSLPTTTTAGRRIGEIAKRGGVFVDDDGKKPAGAHDFRRSFGTRWARRVMPAVLQRLMRHAAIQTTLRYYVDLDVEDAAAEVWAAFEKASNKNGNTTTSEGGNGSATKTPQLAAL